MVLYRASIEYNPANMRLLAAAINNTFKYGLKVIYMGICLLLLILGAFIGWQNSTGIMLIAFGCFLIPSVNAMEKSQANRAIKQLNGQILHVSYTFYDDSFKCANAKEENIFPYSSLIRLVDGKGFFYLFPNAGQAYMIDKSALKPSQENQFKEFLAQKTGLQWTIPLSLMTLNLKQLQHNRKNTRLSKKK